MYRYFRYIVPVLLTIIHSVCNITSCELDIMSNICARDLICCVHIISHVDEIISCEYMLFAKHIMHTINYVMYTCLLYDMVIIHVSLMIYCNAHESHVVEIKSTMPC